MKAMRIMMCDLCLHVDACVSDAQNKRTAILGTQSFGATSYSMVERASHALDLHVVQQKRWQWWQPHCVVRLTVFVPPLPARRSRVRHQCVCIHPPATVAATRVHGPPSPLSSPTRAANPTEFKDLGHIHREVRACLHLLRH